jgi:hypothetical protein
MVRMQRTKHATGTELDADRPHTWWTELRMAEFEHISLRYISYAGVLHVRHPRLLVSPHGSTMPSACHM